MVFIAIQNVIIGFQIFYFGASLMKFIMVVNNEEF